MNQIYPFKYVKAWLRLTLSAAVVAIVVISPHLASAETPTVLSMPKDMAAKMAAPETGAETFDTPFFNAKEEPLTLKDFKGRGLVVNFWATWCAPCIREMPSLNRLAKALEGTGVELLTISEDRKAAKVVPEFLKTKGLDNLKFHHDPKGLLSRKFGIVGLPSTVLINAEGVYMGRVMGTLEWDREDIKAFLVQGLAPKSPPAN
jgi:thiol-disulfide isomerase/thioredoxin